MMSQAPPPSAASAHKWFYGLSPILENSDEKLLETVRKELKADILILNVFTESQSLLKTYIVCVYR